MHLHMFTHLYTQLFFFSSLSSIVSTFKVEGDSCHDLNFKGAMTKGCRGCGGEGESRKLKRRVIVERRAGPQAKELPPQTNSLRGWWLLRQRWSPRARRTQDHDQRRLVSGQRPEPLHRLQECVLLDLRAPRPRGRRSTGETRDFPHP
jgi:hypothetical protein